MLHLALVLLLASAPALGDEHLDDEALVATLRQGGFNIYFRHAQTNWSLSDHVRQAGDWRSCDPARMRQLSDAGRETSRMIGEAIRTLAIPVGLVLASPYCRTVETAQLMSVGTVRTSTDVMNLRAADYFGGREAIVATARRLLATMPAPGTNTVVVAHGNVAREATPVYPGEAEAVVFKPDVDGGFTVLARITTERWLRMAQR